MDNFKINVVSEGKDDLVLAFKIAFRHKKDSIVGYRVCPDKGLIFYRYASQRPQVVHLPFTLDAEGAADFAARWLEQASYGPEPDHDGDNGKGWRLYWGQVASENETMVAVKPNWAMYGK